METYYADFLKKEDHTGKWRVYWTTLNATGLYFQLGKMGAEHENFQQFVEISPGSTCALAKRKMYSFRFKLETDGVTYTFKCDSVFQRYRWMYMIDLVVNGRPPEAPPNTIPRPVVTDSKHNNTNSFDEKDSCDQNNAKPNNLILKSSSFTQTFQTFQRLASWRKKRNNSLPSARCLRKIGTISTGKYEKLSNIHSSFDFADTKDLFDKQYTVWYTCVRPCETRRNESRDQSDLKLRDVKCGRGPVGKCSQVVFASNRLISSWKIRHFSTGTVRPASDRRESKLRPFK